MHSPSLWHGLSRHTPHLICINAANPQRMQHAFMFRRRLTRDIAVIVAVKIAIIIAAAQFVFGPSRVELTAKDINARVLHLPKEIRQ